LLGKQPPETVHLWIQVPELSCRDALIRVPGVHGGESGQQLLAYHANRYLAESAAAYQQSAIRMMQGCCAA
jgi:hypothetical protein